MRFQRNVKRAAGVLAFVLILAFVSSGSPTFGDDVYFQRGNSNLDADLDLSDALYTLGFLFSGGPRPDCADAADANDDGALDIADAISTLGFLFTAAQPPGPNFGECGWDDTFDDLGCAEYSRCDQPAIEFEVVDGWAIVEGDIIIGTPEEFPVEGEGGGASVARDLEVFRWPQGVVPYIIDAALPNPSRVTDAIDHWEEKTSLRFIDLASTSSTFSNSVRFIPGSICGSPVGRMQVPGEQPIILASGCRKGQVIHEIGHTIGFYHEQSRPDRDDFVNVIDDNIVEGKEGNFDIRTNTITCGPYDYSSVMHYGARFFADCLCDTIETIPPGSPIGQRNGLSMGDLCTVASLYDDMFKDPCECAGTIDTGSPPAIGRADADFGDADLTILSLTQTDNVRFPNSGGFEAPVSVFVKNKGTGLANPFILSFEIPNNLSSTLLDFVPQGQENREEIRMCLGPAGNFIIEGVVLFDDSFLGQTATLRVRADAVGEVDETDETNNTAELEIDFPDECRIIAPCSILPHPNCVPLKPIRACTFNPPAEPDLIVTQVTKVSDYNFPPTGGYEFHVSITVQNVGSEDSGESTMRLYRIQDQVIGGGFGGLVVGNPFRTEVFSQAVESLAPGGSRNIVRVIHFNEVANGQELKLEAVADDDETVDEANEDNNTRQLIITLPPLVL